MWNIWKGESITTEDHRVLLLCISDISAYDAKKKEYEIITKYSQLGFLMSSLFSIKWAEKFGKEEIDGMVARCRMAFEDYDSFQTVIPKWYPYFEK